MNFLAARPVQHLPESASRRRTRRTPRSTRCGRTSYLDAGSSIDYETVGSSPDRAFVIEYSNIKVVRGEPARDRLRGQALGERQHRPALRRQRAPTRVTAATRPSASRTPTAPTRSSSRCSRSLLDPNSAYPLSAGADRHRPRASSPTPTTASRSPARPSRPSPAAARRQTGADGTYALRLLPGSYTLTVSSDRLRAAVSQPGHRRSARSVTTLDFALDAADRRGRPDRDRSRRSTSARRPTSR